MKRLGFNNMGKDIDRNITRQLWERFKNTFSRNDVIPVKNGGTGVNNLELFYPKLVQDKFITKIFVIHEQLIEGFKAESDCTAIIILHSKSFYINGKIHISRESNISTNEYLKIKLNHGGYDIHNITFKGNSSKFSIINDTLILEGFFDSRNTYTCNFDGVFVPFI